MINKKQCKDGNKGAMGPHADQLNNIFSYSRAILATNSC